MKRAEWWRSIAVVASLIVAGVVVAILGARVLGGTMPAGSSRSAQPDGALALRLWSSALGMREQSFSRLQFDDAPPRVLFVIQPQRPFSRAEMERLEVVTQRGGTVVLAGDPAPAQTLARALGVRVGPLAPQVSATWQAGGGSVRVNSRLRVDAPGASPILVAQRGEVVALRKPHSGGSILVIGDAFPLTNEGLRDATTARFVYQEVLAGVAPGEPVGFDDAHYANPTQLGLEETPTARTILLATPPGQAALYAATVVFVCLLLSGRRLGPSLAPADAAQRDRAMYEHVQALAGLYRQARQLPYARRHFADHYRRRLDHVSSTREAAEALSAIEHATTDAALIGAVDHADDLLRATRRTTPGRYVTLANAPGTSAPRSQIPA